MKWQRWLVIALFLSLLLGAIVYGFMPRPVRVDTATAERDPFTVTVEAEGRTRVKERYVISAPVAGVARRIDLNVGDYVGKDQVVAWLEPLHSAVLDPRSRAQAEARLAAAQASLRVAEENASAARAAAEFARADLARLRRLTPDGVVSQERLDQAQTESRRADAALRAAESAVEVARYELQAARSALEYSAARENAADRPPELVTLKAPVAGRVLRVHQRSAFVVEPGRPLLEIGDPRDLEIEVDVLSSDAVRIPLAGRVLLYRWGGPEPLEGRVRVVEPVGFTKVSALGVEEQRVLVIVDIASPRDEWRSLGDGYRVEAAFVLWEDDDVLQVPSSALLRRESGWAVFVVEQGRARLRPVEVGRRSGLQAQIVARLKAGETVVVHPGDDLADGVAVQPRTGADG